ncbi:MAG TPA: GNAT family N-acetyltransferase [Chitinophagales bacterium]|nr:GNAT family N-acetyltransferase [Chitinophagales bacterium]
MNNKERYRKFCATHAVVPVFSNPFWLDAVAENWDVALICESESRIIAALPYCLKGNLFTKRIYLPDVSFYQSVLFFTDVDKNMKQKLTEQLAQQLPKTVKSYFKFLPEHTAISLVKSGFENEAYGTYIILKDQTLNLSSNHKRNIQRGTKLNYTILESINTELSFSLLTSTFIRQKIKTKISLTEFEKINTLVKKHHAGNTFDCLDGHKNLLASAFIVEDTDSVYYLFGGYDTAFKNSGAMTYLLHYIIQDALQRKLEFNFCGSSKKSIATYFEGFGAQKTPIAIWKKSIL